MCIEPWAMQALERSHAAAAGSTSATAGPPTAAAAAATGAVDALTVWTGAVARMGDVARKEAPGLAVAPLQPKAPVAMGLAVSVGNASGGAGVRPPARGNASRSWAGKCGAVCASKAPSEACGAWTPCCLLATFARYAWRKLRSVQTCTGSARAGRLSAQVDALSKCRRDSSQSTTVKTGWLETCSRAAACMQGFTSRQSVSRR
mmetsp:Transcript_17415/g.53821  ORF Transcript_17415/g.53821 Transcript_17415/m.53821 type:complete len:204 (+) Transcript_17415:107-718(+)